MVDKIVNGITNTLYNIFGYRIYVDNVEQGFEEPCFFVMQITTNRKQELGRRSKRDSLFDIHFFPNGGNAQINIVADKLYENLDMITLEDGDMVHGDNMRTEIQDDVLHFFVNYNVFAVKPAEPVDHMEDIEIGESV